MPVSNPEAVGNARSEVFDDNVGPSYQRGDNIRRAIGFQVDDDATFVGVKVQE